jgi:predicted transcriptional regulator
MLLFIGGEKMKEHASITLDTDVIKRVKDLAAYDDRSFSQYINMVLRRHLNRIEKTEKKQ